MAKIDLSATLPGTEFEIDGTVMVVSGVSGTVSRSGAIESIAIVYDKKPEAPAPDDSKADDSNGKPGRTLASKTITNG